MTSYHVYYNDRLGGEAIQEGFSWPGFLLTWIWAFDKRLWKTGIGLLLLQSALIGLFYAGRVADAPLWVVGALLVDLLSRVFVGLQGSYWRENSMDRRGFIFEATVQAETARAAIGRTELAGATAPALGSPGIAWRTPGALLAVVAAALVLAILGAVWSALREPEPVARRSADGPATLGTALDGPAAGMPDPVEPAGGQDAARPTQRDSRQPAPSLARSRPERVSNGTPPTTRAPAPVESNPPAAATAPAGGTSAPPDTAADQSTSRQAGEAAAGDRSPAAMEAAWIRHYRPTANCVDPADWDTYVECTNQMIRAREAFEQKWAAGQLP